MDAGVNRAGSLLLDPATFRVTPESIRSNLRGPWVVDDDPFQINQFGHPYQGAMYHGIARSNGLSYWPSVVYTFAGSALWEIAGETTPPSANDQIASGIAGSFLGEPLFRISRLLLERADNGPGAWRTLASVLASPPTGINHLLVGNPAGSPRSDAVPFSDIRVQFGVNRDSVQPFADRIFARAGSTASRVVDGLRVSGKRQLSPRAPVRLLQDREQRLGRRTGASVDARSALRAPTTERDGFGGIWGLYGTYDYFSPDDFRFSSTAASFGTTLQAPIAGSLVLQSSGLVGGGYVATHAEEQPGDFHYGVAPQALVNLRLIAGRRAAVDLTAREYFVSGLGGFGTGQRDLIFVGDAWLAVRVYRRHGLALTYQRAGRSSDYLELPDQTRARSTVGVFYTFLGSGGFGAVR